MAGSILGNRVRRTEDPELLTRGGTYVYDLGIEGVLHAVFVRSIMAHARITGIDRAEALAAPGVVAVLTAADLGVAPHHGFIKVADEFARSGTGMIVQGVEAALQFVTRLTPEERRQLALRIRERAAAGRRN